MYDIVIGRSEKDRLKYGKEGTIFLGKHYVKMGQTTSLSNEIYMDVTRSHVVFVCGKRGSGKSYTMGVIAEGMTDLPEEIKKNLAIVMLDTMGIYWTMKYRNDKEGDLLKEWGLEGKELDVKIYTPAGYFKRYKDEGVPTDEPFSIKPSELDPSDWCITFGIDITSSQGVLIERIINGLKEEKKDYDIDKIIKTIKDDERSNQEVKDAVENRFIDSKRWGLFSEEGTSLKDLVKGGQVTVLDVSCYATTPGTQGLRALVIGLVAEKLFVQRMIARKNEELKSIKETTHFMGGKVEVKQKEPLVWMVIDEAHEFLPYEGETAASHPLQIILREGRQPGISLILASQQPGRIHTDVMTQSDIVIAHRITAKVDIDALGQLMQSYMREGLDKQLNVLPRLKGSAIVFDDTNERMYPMRIRPRFTWHGGEAPTAMHKAKKVFEF
ncbi:ATP-binding protein [Candidatus Woesearchaeota archaeon]|nr:ATP-binding protein [Candidatus Woesearchaeota archaeon]